MSNGAQREGQQDDLAPRGKDWSRTLGLANSTDALEEGSSPGLLGPLLLLVNGPYLLDNMVGVWEVGAPHAVWGANKNQQRKNI